MGDFAHLVTNPAAGPQAEYRTVGVAWVDAERGTASITFGRQRKDEQGNLVEIYPELTLKPGDKLSLVPNSQGSANEKAPTHLLRVRVA